MTTAAAAAVIRRQAPTTRDGIRRPISPCSCISIQTHVCWCLFLFTICCPVDRPHDKDEEGNFYYCIRGRSPAILDDESPLVCDARDVDAVRKIEHEEGTKDGKLGVQDRKSCQTGPCEEHRSRNKRVSRHEKPGH